MTNETKHTPTPWKIENWHGDTQIVGPEGSLICIDTTYYPVAPSEEDMANIVKCVNMHDELVEALKLADGFLANKGYPADDPLVRGAILTALAKARGEV